MSDIDEVFGLLEILYDKLHKKPDAYFEQKINYPKNKESKLELDDINKLYKEVKKAYNNSYCYFDPKINYDLAKKLKKLEFNSEYDNYIEEIDDNEYIFDVYDLYNMSKESFKLYFSWRSLVRRGIYKKTNFKYIRLYIYEIINNIENDTSEDALKYLIYFWNTIQDMYKPQISDEVEREYFRFYSYEFMQKLVKNHIVFLYYLTKSELPLYEYIMQLKCSDLEIQNYNKIKELREGNYLGKIDIFSKMSNYNLSKSKIMDTKFVNLLDETLNHVFDLISSFFSEREVDINEMLLKQVYSTIKDETNNIYNYNRLIQKSEKTVEFITPILKVSLERKQLYLFGYDYNDENTKMIGYILKLVESYFREYIGYRKLSLPDAKIAKSSVAYKDLSREFKKAWRELFSKRYQNLLKDSIYEFLSSKKIPLNICGLIKNSKKSKGKIDPDSIPEEIITNVSFDVSNFENIRNRSIDTQKKLIVEDVKIDDLVSAKSNMIDESKSYEEIFNVKTITQDDMQADGEFTQVEVLVMSSLVNGVLCNDDIANITKSFNQLPEVVISNLNEKFQSILGDNVIDVQSRAIYDEYIDDVIKILGR